MPRLSAQTDLHQTVPAHTYQDAISHLNSLVPELFVAPAQSASGGKPQRRKFSLDQIAALTEALGTPQARFCSVLIAGTNGKGSTASTLAAIATASGLRTGLYTSPHLERVNERIKISTPDGLLSDIPDETFARLYFQVLETAQRLAEERILPGLPSYFELLTAIAFLFFRESEPGSPPVDLAILEVGMGGRLDATNIVTPALSVITDIALDHQEWLGDTVAEIAHEKAGILRSNGILVTLPQHPEANQALGEVATGLDVRGVNAAVYTPPMRTNALDPYQLLVLGEIITVDSPLHGAHQHRNLALAVAAAVELRSVLPQGLGDRISAATIEKGIRNTQWPARLEAIRIPDEPEILLDVAHNPAGAWALRAALSASEAHSSQSGKAEGYSPAAQGQVLIFSCLRDKPLPEMAQILFPVFDRIFLVPIDSPRAAAIADLAAAAEATGVVHTQAASIAEAIALARAAKPDRIVISGSLYLVGEARALLLHPDKPVARQLPS